jgi:signal transduction histidine kinase
MGLLTRLAIPRRIVRWAAALLLLMLVALLGEYLLLQRLDRGWAERSRQEEQSAAGDLQGRFAAFQSETRSVAERARARLRTIEGAAQAAAFTRLAEVARDDIALEYRDRRKEVVAWSGNRGQVIDTAMVRPHPVSFVVQGPIYSTFVVSLPTDSGFVVAKRLFDVTFPINNRFISNTAFTSTFTAALSSEPEFRFPAGSGPSPESTVVAVPLKGIDGAQIGTALVSRPTVVAESESVRRRTLEILGWLTAVLALLLAWGVREAPAGPRAVAWTLLVWGTRVAFLWLGFPRSVFEGGIFDPIYFASPFGFGLAQSLGDMALSSVALFLTVVLFGPGRAHPGDFAPALPLAWRRALIAPLAVGYFALVRAFLATVRSAVVDSSLTYNDPASLFPSAEVSVMLASLFLLALALVMILVAIVRFAARAIEGEDGRLPATAGWVVAGGAILLVGAVIGALSPHPLISLGGRGAVVLGSILLAVWIARPATGEASRTIAFSLGAVLLLVPSLDAAVHDLDREHVELMGREILRPVDGWLSFEINRALDEIAQGDAPLILKDGDRDDIEKIAFTQWAKSILSKEGNDCSVTFVDVEGSVISDFHIGVGQQWFRRHPMDEMPRSNRLVEVDERGDAGGLVKWYRGYAPVYAADSSFLGGVWVDLAGSNQRMLRGETEEILRNSSREDFANHHRKLYFFEYFGGALASSTLETAPLGSALPAKAAEADSTDGAWLDVSFGRTACEMFYLPDGSRGKEGSGIGLGLGSLGMRARLFAFLRYASFFFLGVLAWLAATAAAHVVRGRRPAMGFRGKLLAAFLVVSLIPLVIVAYSNRVAATERATEATEKDLARQTLAVSAALERTLGAGTPALVAGIADEQCEDLASTLDVDFNIYRGSSLQASSKPEMFVAELLDHSLSAAAYVNVVLEHRSFFAERQSIGALPYIVGYRPLLSEDGRVVGVVSVPTLFSRNEVESELSQRNALLYGAYAFALLLSIVVGTIFANQISSPVRRLREATGQLASGNMEIALRRSSADELGDLEESFSAMAARLKRSQEQMLKAQKELAWREMAKQVAHEIKNPLTPMKLSVQHLRQAYRDGVKDFDEVLSRVTATVLEQIDALSRIASEFSNVARMPERSPEPVDVHEILREALNLYHAGAIRIETDLGATASVVRADREELRRAFINVLRNSVQAMGESGTIRIATSSAEGTLSVRLSDTGPGIAPEVLARLFEPNFSTKTDGMGLGLTLVRSTIEQLGGSLSVESAPGEGTMVRISLPLGRT